MSTLPVVSEVENSEIQPIEEVILSPTEHAIVELHLDGQKNITIAAALGCTPQTISNTINRPHVKKYINSLINEEQERLEALHGKFVDVIADGLSKGSNINTRLKAARLYKDSVNKDEKGKSAEDIVAKLLNLHVNVQVNTGE